MVEEDTDGFEGTAILSILFWDAVEDEGEEGEVIILLFEEMDTVSDGRIV